MRTKASYFGIVALIALLDQLTKAWVLQSLVGHPPKVLWEGTASWYGQTFPQVWFELQHTTNKGAAWGIFSEHTMWLAALSGVMIFVIGSVLVNARKEERLLSFALALMLGGAFGNLLDRVVHKEVTDFLHCFLPLGGFCNWVGNTFHWLWMQNQVAVNMPRGIYDFPIFNVADSAVVVGTVLLLSALVFPVPLPDETAATAETDESTPPVPPPAPEHGVGAA
ncbi:MAG: signal peptidase II [bacterium]